MRTALDGSRNGRGLGVAWIAAGILLIALGFGARRFVVEGPGRGPFFRTIVRASVRHGDGPEEKIPAVVGRELHRFAGNLEAVFHALGGALLLAGTAGLFGRRLRTGDTALLAAVLLAAVAFAGQARLAARAVRSGLFSADDEGLRRRFFERAARVAPLVVERIPEEARFLVIRPGDDPHDVVRLGYLVFPRRLCTPSGKVPPLDLDTFRRLLASEPRVREYCRLRRYRFVVDGKRLFDGDPDAVFALEEGE